MNRASPSDDRPSKHPVRPVPMPDARSAAELETPAEASATVRTSPALDYLCGPAALLCLVVLAFNDHLLKGAGWLPGLVTGKLSDFAGLLIAPALLSLALRRFGQRGAALAHLAVGVGFVAIKCSPTAAQSLCHAVAFIGLDWTIVPDPTDLMALSVLPLAWLGLRQFETKAKQQPLRRVKAQPSRRWQMACIGVHLVFCTASSNSNNGDDLTQIEGSLFIHNDSELDAELRIATLGEGIQLDCNRVAADPGRLLTDVAFSSFRVIQLEAAATVAVEQIPRQRRFPCNAALVEGPTIDAAILFWFDQDHPSISLDVDDLDIIRTHAQVLALQDDGAGNQFLLDRAFNTVYGVQELDESGLPASCELASNNARLAWSEGFPEGLLQIAARHPGIDDCVAIEFDSSDIDGVDLSGQLWHLCMPIEFPFDVEEWVEVGKSSRTSMSGAGQTEGLYMSHRPNADNRSDIPRVELLLSRGAGVIDDDENLVFTPVELPGCRYEQEEGCGTIQRRAALTVTHTNNNSVRMEHDGAVHILPGAGGQEIELSLVSASQRPVVDALCSEGSDDAGFDFELIVIRHASATERGRSGS